MKAAGPPRIAVVLLGQFAPHELTGDLEEEFRAGRSATWYWRQVCGAIAASIGREVRAHPMVPLRAVATGWLALTALGFAHLQLVDVIDRLVLPRLNAWNATWLVGHGIWDVYRVLLWFAVTVATGWVVGRLNRPHRAAAVLTVVALYALQSLYYLTIAALDAHLWALQPPLAVALLTELAYLSGLLFGGIALTPRPEPLLRLPRR